MALSSNVINKKPQKLSPGMGTPTKGKPFTPVYGIKRGTVSSQIKDMPIRPTQQTTSWGSDAERAIINNYLKTGKKGNPYVNSIIDRYEGSQKSNVQAPLGTQQQAEQAMSEAKQKTEASKASALGYYDQAMAGIGGLGGNIESNTARSLGYYQPVMNELNAMQGDLISPEELSKLTAERKATLAASGQNLTGAFGDADSGIQTGRRLGIAQDTASRSANLPIDMQLNINAQNRASKLGLLGQKAGIAGSMANIGAGEISNRFNLANLGMSAASGKAGIQQNYQYDPGQQYFQQLGQAEGAESKKGTGVSYVPSPIRISTSGTRIGVGGNTISSGRKTPTLRGNTISGMRKLPSSGRFR